jgi:hypothetical protein
VFLVLGGFAIDLFRGPLLRLLKIEMEESREE